jgi:hypothetical protein
MKSFVGGMLAALLFFGAFAWWSGEFDRPKPVVPALPPLPSVDDHDPVTTNAEPGDGPLVPLPDLSGVDRSLVPLPGWHDPRFCLLVFGKREPKARVWLVEDGDTLYVDRDGSGSLADPAKAFGAIRSDYGTRELPNHEWTYRVGDVTPGGSEKHTGLEVVRYQSGGDEPKYVINVRTSGKTWQCAGWEKIFAKDRESAPVIHFGGPVVPKLLRAEKFTSGEDRELHLCVGTPGLGKGSFAYVSCDDVPRNVHPVAKIHWPGDGLQSDERYLLKKRC